MAQQGFETVTFDAKAPLFIEGDKADFAYIIKKGSVQVLKKGSKGRNMTIATIAKGGIVGEMAIISETERSATVIAIEPIEAIAISRDTFEKRLESVDPFLYSLISLVVTRLQKTSEQTIEIYEKLTKQSTEVISNSPKTKKYADPKKNLGNVNLLLADPNHQTRNSLRSGLFGQGFREISDARGLYQIEDELEKKQYDLLILDTSFGLFQVKDLIKNIRNGTIGNNPFMFILVLSENKDDLVKEEMFKAGCDDILFRPLSIAKVMQKIKRLSGQPRNFIVSDQYTGPDHFNFAQKPKKGFPHFEAPNTLCEKILKGSKLQNFETTIQRYVDNFQMMKTESCSV